jgi:hypothetical protein
MLDVRRACGARGKGCCQRHNVGEMKGRGLDSGVYRY